jgi:fructose-bisphosphate aldolase class II
MLVNLKDVLPTAKKNKYAVGLFNTVNLEFARGVIAAAEETRSPVIIGTAQILFPYGPLEYITGFLMQMAKDASVPVVLHLDHGLNRETCLQAIKLGYRSIMYDCSTDSLEENKDKVKEITEIAHSHDVTVEAELGHVGNNDTCLDPLNFMTDPEEAEEFVSYTGIDALAVSVGNLHGPYKFPPKLNFDLIRTIAGKVPVPLVLHGGSGLSDDDFKTAIACGISKVNIFTDINTAGANAAAENYSPGKGLTDLSFSVIDAIKAETIKKILLFGSNNKGAAE